MGFLIKLETLINQLLFKLGALIVKIVPRGIKTKINKILGLYEALLKQVNSLPEKLKNLLVAFLTKAKLKLTTIDFKKKIQTTIIKAREVYRPEKPSHGIRKIKIFLATPFVLITNWLQGLSTAQSVLLLTFSAGSFLSVLGIYYSGQRMADSSSQPRRTPAGQIQEVAYERPWYYKKQTRHFGLVNFRLPVYVNDINEIKSVDIDFTATLSNRFSKKFLEKNEFQLRDFIILHMEPTVGHFPLKEEGKDIIRKKLLQEINNFLIQHRVEGKVTELKIVYVLAN